MKIMITVPSWSVPHGGIRVILEWANRLTKWHEVYLYNLKPDCVDGCTWFNISDKVNLSSVWLMDRMDALIITSPHSIHLEDHPYCPKKVFIFMQMLEHMFRPEDSAWQKLCYKFYGSQHPMICISSWNLEEVCEGSPWRKCHTYLVGNGVNLDDFPIENKKKDGKTVLIEGLYTRNPSKDRDGIGYQVISKLYREGYTILAYSQNKPAYTPGTKFGERMLDVKVSQVVTEFYHRPSLEEMNNLYNRATILIKATRYDARSCAPMEAMTKGCVTARAMIKGDDDLVDGYNCLRAPYNAHYLYQISKSLLTDPKLREELASNGYKHLEENSWDIWMDRINSILTA